MIKAETFLKLPRNFKDKCKVYAPSVREVLEDDNKGLHYASILTETYEEIHDNFTKSNSNIAEEDIPTPYKFVLINCYANDLVKEEYVKAFTFFLKEPVTILPELETIVIGVLEEELDPDRDLDEPRLLIEEDYFDFQNYIREAIGMELVTEVEDFEKELPQIRRMKQLGRERERIAAKQRSKNGKGVNFDTSLVAICCMGIGLNPLTIGEIAYASVTPLIKMFQAREDFDTNMHLIYAGADAKKIKPEYWVRDFAK